jgi:hypothetical protein
MARKEYKRLTRTRSQGMFAVAVRTRASLWLGEDHLLMVKVNGYTETYKRFYYRDIQALITQRTKDGMIVNIVLGSCLFLALICALASETIEVRVVFLVLAGIMGLITLINVLSGTSCKCFVRTAVQVEQLPPLNRLRRARKAIDRLRPLITDAQGGELSPQMISEQLQKPEPAAGATAASPGESGIPPVISP